jgi:hypothetical protein
MRGALGEGDRRERRSYPLTHRRSTQRNPLKLKGKEPQAWLTDVIERLLPWRWKAEQLADAVEA